MGLCLLAQTAHGQACKAWKEAVRAGELQVQLKEASGVAASRRFANRLYHINDSGDSGRFYITDWEGNNTKAVAVEGFRPEDAEALSLGPCGAGRSCLFLGDIGDNNRARRAIEIAVIDEVESFSSPVKPRKMLKLQYPDGPHDAESMAVHPNGGIFILTKEHPARLFRADFEDDRQKLTQVMTLDIAGVPTDMATTERACWSSLTWMPSSSASTSSASRLRYTGSEFRFGSCNRKKA
jgi:hypothetical protein